MVYFIRCLGCIQGTQVKNKYIELLSCSINLTIVAGCLRTLLSTAVLLVYTGFTTVLAKTIFAMAKTQPCA